MNRGDVVELDWPFSDRSGSKTLDQALVVRRIGRLSDAIMQHVDGCLKVVLEIP